MFPTLLTPLRVLATISTIFVLLRQPTPLCHGQALPSQVPAVSLVNVTPQGDNVPPPDQIVLTFDRPVVPIGRMERTPSEIGISISPPVRCEWRWINTSTLGCSIAENNRLNVATTYTIEIPRTFDKTRGEVLAQDTSAAFTTSRPRVTETWFKGWNSPGSPVLAVAVNQRVTEQSLKEHLILEDASQKTHDFTIAEMTPSPEDGNEPPDESEKGLRWLVAPKAELPLDTKITLKVTPGLAPLVGTEAGTENRAVVSFQTFPAFSFLGVACRDTKGAAVEFLVAPTAKPITGKCDPLNAVQLLFSAPVLKEKIKDALKTEPDLKGGRTDFDPWEEVYSSSRLTDSHFKNQRYYLNLPYGLRANATYKISALATTIRDEFNRPLTADISAAFTTSHRAPRYHLENQISVLEKDTDSKLPLIVNNLSAISLSYQAITNTSNTSGLTKTLSPYNAQDIAYPYPIDVRELLGGQSGIIQGTLSTTPKTQEGPKWFLSQVTPYEVHAKLGHFSSLAWVTSFATGKPIANAKVSIVIDTMTNLGKNQKALVSAQTDENGIAQLPGIHTFDPELKLMWQWEASAPRLFVTAEKDGDIAYLPVTWDFQVYSADTYSVSQKEYGHVHSWGTTAQGVYKAGDTVQFALWVRNQNDKTFVSAPRSTYKVEVADPTGKIIYEGSNITLSEFGGYAGEFTTKKDAAVGWYTFKVTASFTTESWEPLRVLISDFTPASFRVSSEVKGALFHSEDPVTLTTEARLHAGGPHADAAARVTGIVKGAPLAATEPRFSQFFFESDLSRDSQVYQEERKLDASGNLTTTVKLPVVDIAYGDLVFESAVRDDRGKYVADTIKARFVGRDRFAGVAQSDWLLTSGKAATFQGLIIDERGMPLANLPFAMTVEYEETKATRVKSAGNVYTTNYENQWVEVYSCKPTSAADAVSCSFTPTKPGEYRITASVIDTKNRTHKSSITRWATGSGFVLWGSGENTELQIVSEKASYKVGDTARFLIQNPYPGAQALFTTERYGIQSSWTKLLKDNTEVVELPITADHIPGIYLSATIVSPRVDKPIENKVDLGKPAFKMGYAKVTVIDPAKKIAVDVKSSAQVFKPKDTVTIDIAGRAAGSTSQPLDYAVTVLDEGVFDLIQAKEGYFDPYRGFYTLDELDVRNLNLIRMLIGRQKFEKKGANAGGDGGSTLDMRAIKKYVSYWNPSVKPDKDGKATISFEAPDNLTGWKVLVMALTKDDQMGLGTTTFKVNKDIEVRSALPNQVRQGDTFAATFTVMNRSETARSLTVEAKIEGDAVSATTQTTTLTAEPFKRYPVRVQGTANRTGEARFIVSASDALARDSVASTLQVLPKAALQTAASFGTSDGKEVKESIAFPSDMQTSVGSVGVILSSSVLGALEGAFSYMKEYPYSCWEQKISRAVMAANYLALREHLPKSFEWKDADADVKNILSDLSSHQATNGGMTFYAPDEEHVSPYLSAYTALALSWLREKGYQIPKVEEDKLHDYLASLLKNDEFPTFFSPGMRSSVRAVALAALARSKKLSSQDLLRYKRVLKEMNLFGVANYLTASAITPDGIANAVDAERQLLSFANQSAATMTFTEPVEAVSERILDSNMRTQCAVLDSFLTLASQGDAKTKERLSLLLPKLVQSITFDRKRKDRWENTQENVFCSQALARYAGQFEATRPNLTVAVRLDTETLGKATLSERSSEPVELSRPVRATDVGRTDALTISPEDKGRFYYTSRLTYAPQQLKSTPTNAGMELTREYSVQRNGQWTILKAPVAITQGELVKVDLFLRLPAPRSYVVVDDPIPGGLEAVNRDLATSSTVDADQGAFIGSQASTWFDSREWIDYGATLWSFYHKELRHSSARFYSEYLPAGNYHLSYVSQAIAPGTFVILPAHAEQMYTPDLFGDSAPDTLTVTPAS